MTRHISIEDYEEMEDVMVNVTDPAVGDDVKAVPFGSREHILNLQLIMATSSVNHEYARMEYDEVSDLERKEELNHYMAECRDKYDVAREELANVNPLVLETFESELAQQKRSTMVHYHA